MLTLQLDGYGSGAQRVHHLEQGGHLARRHQVPMVDRVERPTHDADLARFAHPRT